RVSWAGLTRKSETIDSGPSQIGIYTALPENRIGYRPSVGAVLSVVYIAGAVVMLVGCGQSYTDLKKLNVKSIVKTLLQL
ncbi:hypothetical protein ACLOJK_003630, partial [Asimina triloba]